MCSGRHSSWHSVFDCFSIIIDFSNENWNLTVQSVFNYETWSSACVSNPSVCPAAWLILFTTANGLHTMVWNYGAACLLCFWLMCPLFWTNKGLRLLCHCSFVPAINIHTAADFFFIKTLIFPLTVRLPVLQVCIIRSSLKCAQY